MLLKDSLSGSSKTCIFCTVADEDDMVSESVATLRYGLSCGHVKMNVQQNQAIDLKSETANMEKHYTQLKMDLDELR